MILYIFITHTIVFLDTTAFEMMEETQVQQDF